MKTTLAIVLSLVVLIQATTQYTSIFSVRDVEDWLSGLDKPINLTCCNKCPPPKVNIIKHWTTKLVPINIPQPVIKHVPHHQSHECPEGFKQVSNTTCEHYVPVFDNKPCPIGYVRVDDKKCVKRIILHDCPTGFVFEVQGSKAGCVPAIKKTLTCPAGYVRQNEHQCVQIVDCPEKGGFVKDKNGVCIRRISKCPKGYRRVGRHGRCLLKTLKCPRQICLEKARRRAAKHKKNHLKSQRKH